MAYKRLAGVVTVKEGTVVKSYGYRFWRPAGGIRTALRNLDRWQVDEILLLDISRRGFVDPAVVEEIRAARISTPLAYGGGIHRHEDLDSLLAAGCERFVLETMLFKFPERIQSLANKVGSQALIASLPLAASGDEEWRVDQSYAARWEAPAAALDTESLCSKCNDWPVSEVLAIDSVHEGNAGRFALASSGRRHPLADLQKGIIWFGGIHANQATELLREQSTVAVAFGNANFEREVTMRSLRKVILRGCGPGTIREPSERS